MADIKRHGDNLTHVAADGNPTMVDVSGKASTVREATASCRVVFPEAVADTLKTAGLHTAKGPVIATAIVAGTMAVKRTHELIPFCHPLPIHGCEFRIDWADADALLIRCTVRTEHRTGVEMEALIGVTIAALTVYDMCKALSHQIVLRDARLVSKRGGKRDSGNDDAD